MRNKKISASVLIFLFSASFFLYLRFDFNLKRAPILAEETGSLYRKNSLEKENRSSLSLRSLKESKTSFLDFTKFWSNFMKPKITGTFSDEISRSNKRSFEDRCLTTFNRSLGALYFENSQNFDILKTEEGKKYKKILAYHYVKFDAVLVHFRNIKKIKIPEKSYGNVYKKADFATEDLNSIEKFSYSLNYVMKTKNKLVSWLVSNCNTPSKRGEYVRELQKFIPVDVYGRCGPLKCGQKKQEARCYKKIEKEYKFYLSFENNFCKDYVTEKFYRIL
ncbi:hypothetical protein Anas_12378, partial [Armadillidium nasatum]